MAHITKLSLTDTLPLTCSRAGTCCFGKQVNLNPWELAHLSKAKEMNQKEFRDNYCEHGGIKLRFNGESQWKGQSACSQYIPNFGCSVHLGRPLACRLYPLGRQKQNSESHYIHEGKEFPCLEDCTEVVDLHHMTVGDYISGQGAGLFEIAQDAYLEVMQNLADGAFVLLLDSGLAESGDRTTLQSWKIMGSEDPNKLAKRIGYQWMERLMLPNLPELMNDPVAFSSSHYVDLGSKAEELFGTLENLLDFGKASVLMMAMALHLGRSLGANPSDLADFWVKTAKEHGAKD